MKKNVLIKGILLLVVASLLTIGFTGCGVTFNPFPTTGKVVITIAGSYSGYNYDVYLDNYYNYIGTTSGRSFTVTGLTPGSYFFYVEDSTYSYYWDEDNVYVTAGQTSSLTLYPSW
jgi:hypothetical protein